MRGVAGLPPHLGFGTMETRFHGAHVCLLTAKEPWLLKERKYTQSSLATFTCRGKTGLAQKPPSPTPIP